MKNQYAAIDFIFPMKMPWSPKIVMKILEKNKEDCLKEGQLERRHNLTKGVQYNSDIHIKLFLKTCR